MKLGAILPLCVRGSYDVDDLTRSEILFRSLTAFAEPGLFDPFLIVTPPNEVEIVRERYGNRWDHLNVTVISEEELVPEFARHRDLRGWRKQQIVKLAAGRYLNDCDFFVTFDADVICSKPLRYQDMVVNGKAILQYEPRDIHPKWWRASARIWGIDQRIGNPSVGMSVTPAIMSTAVCRAIEASLTIKGTTGTWVDQLCSMHNKRDIRNLSISRIIMRRWTEYSLYYLYLLKEGLFDQYHVEAGTPQVPQLMMSWECYPFETWDPATTFTPNAKGLFCVIGSKTMLTPEVVWNRVKAFIPAPSPISNGH